MYNAKELITDAYYIAGVNAREFQETQGYQIQTGLKILNDVISDKAVEKDMIPYNSECEFTAVIGQQTYFIEGLESLDTLTFFMDNGNVRYPMTQIGRINYFGTARVDNIKSLPFTYHVERCLNGANIYLYFSPDKAYLVKGWGLYRLLEVNLDQDLSLTIDRFYLNYLKYATAVRICVEFNLVVPQGAQTQLSKYEDMIQSRSAELDLVMQKSSTLGQDSYINYAFINLGFGWVPS